MELPNLQKKEKKDFVLGKYPDYTKAKEDFSREDLKEKLTEAG